MTQKTCGGTIWRQGRVTSMRKSCSASCIPTARAFCAMTCWHLCGAISLRHQAIVPHCRSKQSLRPNSSPNSVLKPRPCPAFACKAITRTAGTDSAPICGSTNLRFSAPLGAIWRSPLCFFGRGQTVNHPKDQRIQKNRHQRARDHQPLRCDRDDS